MTDSKEAGVKFDDGKLPLDLISPYYLDGTAAILQFGAKKYAAYNWAKGMKWSRVYAALMRHMWAWWRGEKVDKETGMSHLWHASCCLMFLVHYEATATGEDDRPAYVNNNKEVAPKDGPITEHPTVQRLIELELRKADEHIDKQRAAPRYPFPRD